MTAAETRPTQSREQPSAAPDRRRQIVLTLVAGLAALAAMAVPALWVMSSQTSSASFADTEVLDANQLGAAVLDLEIEANPDATDQSADGTEGTPVDRALLSAANLAPGDRISGQLAMSNAGDAPLRYGLFAVEEAGVLGTWLRFELWAADGICAPDQAGTRVTEDVQVGRTPVALMELDRPDGTNVLGPGESVVWCVGATLPLDTPNEAQGQRLDLSVLVMAEQFIEDGP